MNIIIVMKMDLLLCNLIDNVIISELYMMRIIIL